MTTTGPAAVAATTRIGVPDEDQDMAVIWKRTLVELHRLDEIQTSSDKTIAELDKLSEGAFKSSYGVVAPVQSTLRCFSNLD